MDESLAENAGCIIFVGSIPASASREDVEHYFSQFGDIVKAVFSQKKQRKRSTQRNPGHCQIVTGDQETAKRILKQEYHLFQGRRIVCQPLRKGGSLKKNNHLNNQRRVIVKGLPAHYTDSDLYKVFRAYGEIDVGFIIGTKGSKGNDDIHSDLQSASIQFKSQADASKLVALQTILVEGRQVLVESYRHDYSRAKILNSVSDDIQPQNPQSNTNQRHPSQVSTGNSEFSLKQHKITLLQQQAYITYDSLEYSHDIVQLDTTTSKKGPKNIHGLDTQIFITHHIKPTLKIYHVGRFACSIGADLRFNIKPLSTLNSKIYSKPGVSGGMVGTARTLSLSVSNRSTRRFDN